MAKANGRITMVRIRYPQLRRHLQPILEEWTKLICRYTENVCPTDALYWYNERATLSTLAHAIARRNHIVLEEYRIQKRSVHDGRWEGRADLYFICGETGYVAEAKQMWLPLSRRTRTSIWQQRINKMLTQAKSEAVTAKEYPDLKALGVVFVVPYITHSKAEDCQALVEGCIKQMRQVKWDAMACAFPRKAETYSKRKCLHPGVFCLIRLPKRS